VSAFNGHKSARCGTPGPILKINIRISCMGIRSRGRRHSLIPGVNGTARPTIDARWSASRSMWAGQTPFRPPAAESRRDGPSRSAPLSVRHGHTGLWRASHSLQMNTWGRSCIIPVWALRCHTYRPLIGFCLCVTFLSAWKSHFAQKDVFGSSVSLPRKATSLLMNGVNWKILATCLLTYLLIQQWREVLIGDTRR